MAVGCGYLLTYFANHVDPVLRVLCHHGAQTVQQKLEVTSSIESSAVPC